jgi:hypothetical protein
LTLSPTETALALQTLQGPKGESCLVVWCVKKSHFPLGTIAENDFTKWLSKRDKFYGTEEPLVPPPDNLSDAGKTVSTTNETKTNLTTKRRSKKVKGASRTPSQDEILRLNHPW